ncbi:hypothetical protein [Fodinibius halophilus]|uniref:Uncharacterized protein n=1 Tax=Fodinibius halophilus TaxID=1736908 RepID=A0A6M1SUQ7_9BACT|nr:hypothetical protein [Fodinibius halophilus]NGP87296.1 hypothetical protein [Fodinibius halophilus]
MKKLLLYLTAFCFICSCLSGTSYQKMVLKEVINDPNNDGLFDDRETINLLANKYSIWEPGTEINLPGKKVKTLSPSDSKELEVIEFTSYVETDSTISVEMNLLHKNAIYKANFKKEGRSLKKLSSNLIFVRRPLQQ